MADNIKGITVEIGGDTSKLQQALKSADKSIKTSQSSLKEINKLLKFDDGSHSAELLAQKQKALADTIEQCKSKVEALKQAQDEASKAFSRGDIGQDAYDELSRSVIKAEQQLAYYTNQLGDTDAELLKLQGAGEEAAEAVKEEGNEAEKAVVKNNNFGQVVGAVAASLGAIALAAGKAALELGKSVVESYAEFEQLVGGVETLFGTGGLSVEEYAQKTGKSVDEITADYERMVQAEETVLANADEAYKTAGLSATQYMETVTSFSASLIQSLDGDTQKAAEKANQAIIDMSDNANKMGTDISSIQNAYQGFAKQQYQLLDNLKLGYGGTKTEMERLLADAEKFSGIKYDISSYSDVIDAIHVIQTEMGITGTTAKEATDTITGSINMTKSAYENFITSLGTGEGVDDALNDLADSFSNVVRNIEPVIERLVMAIPSVMESILPIITSMLPSILDTVTKLFQQVLTVLVQAIPTLIPVVVQMVQTIVNTLLQNTPMLVTSAISLVGALIQGIVDMLPNLIESALAIVQTLANYLIENAPAIATAALELMQQLVGYFMEYAPEILQAGMEIITALATGIIENLPAIIDSISEIINSLTNYILDNLPAILEMGMELTMKIAEGIIQNLPEIITAVFEMIVSFTSTIVEHLPEILAMGIELIGQLVAGIIEAIPQVISGILEVISGMVNTLTESWQSFKDAGANIIDGIVEGIKSAASRVWDAISEVCSDAWEAVTDFFDINSPSRLMRDGVGKMIDIGWAEGITRYADQVSEAADKVSKKVYGSMTNAVANVDYNASLNKTSNIYLTSPVYLDGKFMTQYVNTQLGVLL